MLYRVERFYPSYYTATRPSPSGVPTTLGYGGNYFDIGLSSSDVGEVSNLDNTRVVLVRGHTAVSLSLFLYRDWPLMLALLTIQIRPGFR